MKNPFPTVEPYIWTRPRLYPEVRAALIEDDVCPVCLGELDTGKECNDCDYDAFEEIERNA